MSLNIQVPEWDIYDSSKTKDYMRCPRLYFYEYILGWRSDKPNNDLVFGQTLHLAMEHLYTVADKKGAPWTQEDAEEAADIAETYYRGYFDELQDESLEPKTMANLRLALWEYTEEYAESDFKRYKLLHVEKGGLVPLTEDINVTFRMDLILFDRKYKRVVFMDHKTSKRDYLFAEGFKLSFQVFLYNHALLAHVWVVDGVEYEAKGAIINGIIFYKATTAAAEKRIEAGGTINKYVRVPIAKNMDMQRVWYSEAIRLITKIQGEVRELKERLPLHAASPTLNLFDRNTEMCSHYGLCEFHSFCLSWANPLAHCKQVPSGLRVEHWNPIKEQGLKTNEST